MGLGKSLTMLALISADFSQAVTSQSEEELLKKKTILIAPLSSKIS